MLRCNKEMRYLRGQWNRGTTSPAAPSQGKLSNGFAETRHPAGPWALHAVSVHPVRFVHLQEGSQSS